MKPFQAVNHSDESLKTWWKIYSTPGLITQFSPCLQILRISAWFLLNNVFIKFTEILCLKYWNTCQSTE